MNKNYIENLIAYFSSNPAVYKAYFGLLYKSDNTEDLFLGIEHNGYLEELQVATENIRELFLPDRKVLFASTECNPDLLGIIEKSNSPFYVMDESRPIYVAALKYWLEPDKYRKEFITQVTTGKLRSLFKDFNPRGNMLNFQTFIKGGREFIPLFSDKEMIVKSGMTEVPKGLTVVEFDWVQTDDLLGGKLQQNYYILNPGTSFSIDFTL